VEQAALGAAAAAAGVPWPATADDGSHWAMAFAALRSVWASQYNERAYLSLRKAGLPHAQLCMAVLVQRVVPADYAFVIHTENPSTGNPDEIYIELVRAPGRVNKGNKGSPTSPEGDFAKR
jgi:alpha-glucan,water dikinase